MKTINLDFIGPIKKRTVFMITAWALLNVVVSFGPSGQDISAFTDLLFLVIAFTSVASTFCLLRSMTILGKDTGAWLLSTAIAAVLLMISLSIDMGVENAFVGGMTLILLLSNWLPAIPTKRLEPMLAPIRSKLNLDASTSSGTEDPTEETGNQKGILEILKENKGKLLGTPMVIVICIVFFSSTGDECHMQKCQLPGDYGFTHKYESCNYYHTSGVANCPQWNGIDNERKRYCRQCAGYWADGGKPSFSNERIGPTSCLGVIRHPNGKASRTANLCGIPWYVWVAATVGYVLVAITRARNSKPAGNEKSPEE